MATTTTACSARHTTRGVHLVSLYCADAERPQVQTFPFATVGILLFVVVGGLVTSSIALVVNMWSTWRLGDYFKGKKQ